MSVIVKLIGSGIRKTEIGTCGPKRNGKKGMLITTGLRAQNITMNIRQNTTKQERFAGSGLL